jgi:hypothetical protein
VRCDWPVRRKQPVAVWRLTRGGWARCALAVFASSGERVEKGDSSSWGSLLLHTKIENERFGGRMKRRTSLGALASGRKDAIPQARTLSNGCSGHHGQQPTGRSGQIFPRDRGGFRLDLLDHGETRRWQVNSDHVLPPRPTPREVAGAMGRRLGTSSWLLLLLECRKQSTEVSRGSFTHLALSMPLSEESRSSRVRQTTYPSSRHHGEASQYFQIVETYEHFDLTPYRGRLAGQRRHLA